MPLVTCFCSKRLLPESPWSLHLLCRAKPPSGKISELGRVEETKGLHRDTQGAGDALSKPRAAL